MKKLISIGAALLAGFAIADSVESTTTFGVLKVTTYGKETAISAPWAAAGGGDVKVKDLVKTSNLTTGDQLLLYTPADGTYKGWVLNSDGTWEGATTVTSSGITPAQGGDDTITRGSALIVIENGRDSMTDNNIYLYGQYVSTDVTSWTMTAGKKTLFAPINTTSTAKSLNDYTWTNVATGDIIQIQDSNSYVRRCKYVTIDGSSKWAAMNYTTSTYDASLATIQPGQGAWYISNGTSDVTASTAAN